jgi:hypothetical protein
MQNKWHHNENIIHCNLFQWHEPAAWIELDRLNHQVKVHTVSAPKSMEEAAASYEPDVIVAPYLKTPIPEYCLEKVYLPRYSSRHRGRSWCQLDRLGNS